MPWRTRRARRWCVQGSALGPRASLSRRRPAVSGSRGRGGLVDDAHTSIQLPDPSRSTASIDSQADRGRKNGWSRGCPPGEARCPHAHGRPCQCWRAAEIQRGSQVCNSLCTTPVQRLSPAVSSLARVARRQSSVCPRHQNGTQRGPAPAGSLRVCGWTVLAALLRATRSAMTSPKPTCRRDGEGEGRRTVPTRRESARVRSQPPTGFR